MKSVLFLPLFALGLVATSSLSPAAQAATIQQSIAEKVEFVAYDLKHQPAAKLENLLRPLLAESDDYQLFADPEQNRIYLRGSAEAHQIATQLIQKVDRQNSIQPSIQPQARPTIPRNSPRPFSANNLSKTNNANADSTAAAELNESASNEPPVTRFVSIPATALDSLEKQIVGLFERKLNVIRDQGREILVVSLHEDATRIELEFDYRRNGILIAGPSRIVDQMITLCQALARSNGRDGQSTKVLRVQKANQPQVRELIQPATAAPSNSSASPATSGRYNSQQPSSGNQGAMRSSGSRILPASYVFQENEGPATTSPSPGNQDPRAENPPQQNPQIQNPTEQAPNPQDQSIQQFEGVEIETMPDLDVIILRGREQDLEQLEEIIRQIERISRETQPQIQIYRLRHTQSESLAEILTESQDDLVGGRQGQIAITPLAKPNALLLIGWGEAVTAVLELIRELDVPVDARTQFRVFRIQHATAATINTSIESFFADRGQLGPTVSGVVDDRTNSIIVYAAPRDMLEVARLISELDVPGGMAVSRTQIIPIRNALAADVADTLESAINAASSDSRTAVMELMAFDEKGQQILKSGTLNDVQITTNLRNNTLIITSPRENFDLLKELIRQLDTPPSKSQLKIFKIYNSDAATMVQTLRSLIPGSTSDANNLKLPTAPDEISLTPLRFSVDVRSNSILATGSEGDLRIAEALIAKLDESTSSQRKTEVYPLKNSPAVDVANAINQFLQSSRQVENAAPGSQNPFQELEREVIVVPEPIANKLLVSATSRYFEEIAQLIEKLDEQPPQVMIQVLIAEVNLNDTDEFGIELGLQDSVLFDRSLLGDLLTTVNTTTTSTIAGVVTENNEIIQAADNVPGFNFNNTRPLGNSGSTQALQGAGNVGAQGISNFAVGRSNDQLGFGGLVLSASSQNISLLLRAMQESRRVDILSRPQVRTLDNQPAFIQVGQRVPRIVGSTVNQNGQSNSVSLENVGLILAVTPRISPDGTVVMEIDAEKSDLGTEIDGIPVAVSTDGTVIRSPRVDTTTAQATVSAVDGETIVLGGLITKNTQQVNRSVPYLNRIPLLRNFFKYDGLQSQRSELLIILTPRVIRNPEDNARIRQIETARMNWCAADVFELHGEIDAIENVSTDQLDAVEPPVIYPVENPRGELEAPTTDDAANTRFPRRLRERWRNRISGEAAPLDNPSAANLPLDSLPVKN